jgi:uncharacterized membrane protein YcaP (DUF421 family)
MFELTEPWWGLVARGAILYFALMIVIRLSGKRTVGEFTPFDLVVVVLLGESAQGGLTGGDESVTGAVILAATLVALNYGIAFASTRSKTIDKLVEGEPEVLLRRGVVNDRALKRNNLPASDLDEAIRRAGLMDRSGVELAVLEADGEISVIPRREPERVPPSGHKGAG